MSVNPIIPSASRSSFMENLFSSSIGNKSPTASIGCCIYSASHITGSSIFFFWYNFLVVCTFSQKLLPFSSNAGITMLLALSSSKNPSSSNLPTISFFDHLVPINSFLQPCSSRESIAEPYQPHFLSSAFSLNASSSSATLSSTIDSNVAPNPIIVPSKPEPK